MSNTTRWIFMEKQNTKTNEKDQNISIEKIGAKIEEVKNNTSVLADKQNTISKVEVNTAFPKFKKETFEAIKLILIFTILATIELLI